MSADDSVRNVDNGACEEDDNEECAVMDVGHMTRTQNTVKTLTVMVTHRERQ